MKKIINTPETIVKEMCKGFVLANPTLEFVEKYKNDEGIKVKIGAIQKQRR